MCRRTTVTQQQQTHTGKPQPQTGPYSTYPGQRTRTCMHTSYLLACHPRCHARLTASRSSGSVMLAVPSCTCCSSTTVSDKGSSTSSGAEEIGCRGADIANVK